MSEFKPKIVIFSCDYCASMGSKKALDPKLRDAFCPVLVKITCTGRIDPTFILDAFSKGADGVMVVGDRPGQCHFVRGNYKAMRNVLLLKNMLSQMGIEPNRLKAEWVTAEPPKFLSSLNDFVGEVTQLGPIKAS